MYHAHSCPASEASIPSAPHSCRATCPAYKPPGRATCPGIGALPSPRQGRNSSQRKNVEVVLWGDNLDIFCEDVRHFLQRRDRGHATPPMWRLRYLADDVSYVITNYEAVSDYVGHGLHT